MRARHLVQFVAQALLAASALSCQPSLQVAPVATSVQRPSNVAIYLAVTRAGEPVTDLSVQNFKVYEDGKVLDPSQTDLVILAKDLATKHQVLLLLDLTGAEGVAARRELSRAAAGFVKKARRTQPVSVWAYDGAMGLYPVDEFARHELATEPKVIEKLEALQVIDHSRNLHGAVTEGLIRLDSLLASADRPVRIGTLVVFSSGPDLAGRTTTDQVAGELKRTRHDVIVVTIGNDRTLPVDRAGIFRAESLAKSGDAFDRAAAKVQAMHGGHYLLSYCSPARGGVRDLHVEVSLLAEKGEPVHANAKLGFSAEGFGPGCNSRDIPRFVVTLVSNGSGTVPGIVPSQIPPEPKPETVPEESKDTTATPPTSEEEEEKPAAEAPKKKPKRPRARPVARPSAKQPAKPPGKEPEKKPEKQPEKKPEKKPEPEQDYAP